ncbi:MAG: hypothetical protein NTU57_01425 [Candidatus Aenigmarchaeota archaeon]|nr:hypothetical protein [Candidatus Aenigmarchaeota archaeon]
MFYHVILTTACNGKCEYCYHKPLDDMEETHVSSTSYTTAAR